MSIKRAGNTIISFLGPIRRVRLLGLFIAAALLTSVAACAGIKKKKNAAKKPVEYALTVAAIRPALATDEYIEVTFNESARFYRLPKNADPAYIELLRNSEKSSTPVLVKRANEYSDIILRVRKK